MPIYIIIQSKLPESPSLSRDDSSSDVPHLAANEIILSITTSAAVHRQIINLSIKSKSDCRISFCFSN